MFASSHSQQMQRALKCIDVRIAPKATVSHPTAIRRKGPSAEIFGAERSRLSH
jgi:hypothetical protein